MTDTRTSSMANPHDAALSEREAQAQIDALRKELAELTEQARIYAGQAGKSGDQRRW